MREPIQNTSAEIKGRKSDHLEEGDEPFVSALRERKYEIVWMQQMKSHTFFCSDYDTDTNTPVHKFSAGEWLFNDVIMDTSKFDPQGKPTLIRMTYHPQLSLVNVPFMVLPAEGEKEEVKV
jgi:hypothetical protein